MHWETRHEIKICVTINYLLAITPYQYDTLVLRQCSVLAFVLLGHCVRNLGPSSIGGRIPLTPSDS